MTNANHKKQKGFNGPPTARSEPGRDQPCNFYTPCAYSNNFSKGVDLDLMTVQGYMKDTLRHYRHVHCTVCGTHPVKPWTTIARCNYTRKEIFRRWIREGFEPSPIEIQLHSH